MEADSWSRFSAAAKRYQSALQSRYDLYQGFDEIDGGDEEPRAEFPCPFCSEDFDIVGLCCHIDDEHPVEAKNGVCPVCVARVSMDLVSHLTMQHRNFFKMQRRRRFRRGSSGSHSTLSLLRKELREGNLQALFGGSSYTVPPSNAAPDPFLSSLIYTLPVADSSIDIQPESLDEERLVSKSSDVEAVERFVGDLRGFTICLHAGQFIASSKGIRGIRWLKTRIRVKTHASKVKKQSEFYEELHIFLLSTRDCLHAYIFNVEPSLSEKDQKERVSRSEFVQGLLLSTIFDGDTL